MHRTAAFNRSARSLHLPGERFDICIIISTLENVISHDESRFLAFQRRNAPRFDLPAMYAGGPCHRVSPLVSLYGERLFRKDVVCYAYRLCIHAECAPCSGMSDRGWVIGDILATFASICIGHLCSRYSGMRCLPPCIHCIVVDGVTCRWLK